MAEENGEAAFDYYQLCYGMSQAEWDALPIAHRNHETL